MYLRRALKRAYSSIKSFSLSGESEWISDNFYLLTEFYAMAVKDKNALEKASLYEKISHFCDEKNFCFGEDELIKCVGAAALSLDETRALEKLFAVKAMISLSEGISFKKAFFEEPIFKFLFSLKDGFSEDFYEKVYVAEKLLNSLGDEFIKSDTETKNACRELLFGYAKRQKIREDEAFYKLSAEAEKQSTTVLKLLFAPEKRNKIIFFSSLFIIFSFLAAASVYSSGIYSLLTFIPIFFASVSLSDAVAAALIKPKITPRLDEKFIDKKALVVISALLDGKDGGTFEKLKKFSFSNPEENIFFCLLADLPDSKTKTGDRDGEIFERARENISTLNEKYGDRFCLFFRERSYLESENRFGGKERKRGAIAELIKEIKEGGSESVFGGESFIRKIDYIITLDGDTELSVGSASALIAAAAHPISEIKIENGKIKSGFGIIQPEMKTTLESSYSTLFSYISSSYSGGENYACASYSRLDILFGIGSFCGKGIIDVNAYYKLLSGVLPESKILSHDIVEGSILKTRSATDIFLYDSTPKNVCAYYRRQHRWLRGDFQNLSLIKGKILSPFSKARMFYIAFKDLLPLFAVLPIVLAGFIKNMNAPAAAVFSVSFLLFPYAITLLRSVFNKNLFILRRFFSKAQSAFKTETAKFAFSILTLCREAFLALGAFVLAITRLIKKKKTLEWVTAAQTDAKKYGFSGYVRDGAGSIIVGFILAFFAVKPIIKIFGLLWFIYPLAAAFVSETKLGTGEAKAKLNEKQKKILSAHIKDMWKFFSENVSEDTNFLPPDNIQISPNASTAYRTSPTNIGFYLVSLLSARDIGLIDGSELLKRSEKTLETLLKLPKKNGNFYNWYDIKTCAPLGENYISSVDMGNLVIMLTAFKEGLSEYKESERGLYKCIEICDFLISESELRAFVSEKNRISVGLRFGEKIENSFYDTLMSEARMTAFYIAAKRISGVKIWQSLGRTLTRDGKHIGMMSWSGTAFEYFMPALFLPLYKSSFIYESLCFALYENKKSGDIWGRSESGFFGFDANLNYQYRANGIKSLALRKVSDAENVVSPYSSYLSLCVGGNAVFDNLKKLYSLGAYGKYGFYEAVDFFGDAHGIIVKSYMAHHVGMSVIACMNALYDNIFVKRTMRDGALAGAKGLLCEKIPVGNAVYFKAGAQKSPKTKTNKRFGKDFGGDLKIISDGENTVTVSAKGCISFEKEYASVFRTVFEKRPEFTPKIRFLRDGKEYNPAGDGHSFEKGEDCASFVASGKDFSGSLKISLSKRGALTFETKAEAIKNYDVALSFEPILAKEKEFYSHVAFSRLFIESEYDENKKILFFHRRDRVSGQHIMTLAVAGEDTKSKIEFSASAKDLPFGEPTENIKTDNKTGACITPFCVFKIKNAVGGRAKIFVSAEKTKEECEKVIAHARCGEGSGKTLVFSEDAEKLYEKLLFGIGGNLTQALCGCDENGLWRHGISGDEKIIFAEISDENIRYAEKLISAFFELGRAMIKLDLVFSVRERDFYNSPVTRKIKEYIRENGFAVGKIFVIGSEKLSDAERDNFKAAAVLYVSESGTHFKERENIFNGVITKSGETDEKGGFIGEKYVCINAKKTFSPYGYALSGHRFSSFVTQSSLGYTFYGNAHERKIGVFHGDVLEKSGERIILESENERYDLCACAQNAEFGIGKAVWRGKIGGKSYILTVFVSEKYPLKFIRFVSESEAKIRFYCLPSLESGDFGNCLYSPKRERENVYTLFKKPFSSSGFGFIGALNGEISDNFSVSAEGKSADFFIGYCPSAAAAKRIISRINERFIGDEEKKAEAFDASITHGDDVFFDKFLPRQIYFCRFLARGGFFQSGGAYGFRDQLQDCLAMIYFKPFEVRNHIFRCCAHQYEDGGVMHWWHTALKKGVKTDCSDDMLWLPIAASEYFKETGDASFLKKEIFYLDSPEISAGEERYEPIKYGNLKESVYKHCLRAFEKADRRGGHGLILMGSCDWNDGFSKVGVSRIGESVFTTLLYVYAVQKFIVVARYLGDEKAANTLSAKAEAYKNAIEEHCFFGDRYARAFADGGDVLGIAGRKECEIDILPQAFAALCGLDESRVKTALKTAFNILYDRKNNIFRLFYPPFSAGSKDIGYIRGYPEFIRENGGQYTHGALFGVLGFLSAGMVDEAKVVFDCALPTLRDPKIYGGEPYYTAADVYGGALGGRVGWTGYTGSAAWAYIIKKKETFENKR